MSAPRLHRTTADSKSGRQLAAQTARIERGPGLTPEQIAWNAAVEAKKKAKRDRR